MVIPIGDQNRPDMARAWVNWSLIGANFLVWFYMLTLNPNALQSFVFTYGAVPAQITQGQSLITLITSQFIHGSWLHILGNMVFLLIFGDNIEAALGHWLYLGFYLAAGVIAGLSQVLFSLGSDIPSIGASGSIAAILGAYVALFPNRRVRVLIVVFPTYVSAIVFLGVWALLQLLNGLASLGVPTAQTSGVAVWAHVGGFVFGLLVGVMARLAGRQRRG
jgi:membrane associated rhomboid family serine protease